MALSAQLDSANLTPQNIETSADLSLEKLESGWTVTKIHLSVTARVPGADKAAFDKAAQAAKEGCPISKLLKAATLTMEAKLV